MKLMRELLRESSITQPVMEARRPNLPYSEKMVKNKLDRVIVTLEGTESAALSRVAKRYVRLEKSMEAMKKQRDEMNERLKEEVAGLFDSEDAVVTRVVETVSFTLTLAKEIQKVEPTVKRDYEAIANELAKLIPEELQSKVDEITQLYTTIIPPKPPVKRISVAPISEGVITTVKAAIRAMASKLREFLRWGAKYDAQLEGLKTQLQVLKQRKKK